VEERKIITIPCLDKGSLSEISLPASGLVYRHAFFRSVAAVGVLARANKY